GLDKYVRMEGLSYRLVPVENSNVQQDLSYKNIMTQFAYGNAQQKGVFYDEENRRHLNSLRQAHAVAALSLAQTNRKDSARKILRKYDANVQEVNMPYGFTSNRGNMHNRITLTFLYACYEAGDTLLAKKVKTSLKADLEQQMKYYRKLGDESQSNKDLGRQAINYNNQQASQLSPQQETFSQDIVSCYQMLEQLEAWDKQYLGINPAPTGDSGQKAAAPDTGKPAQ
ncbi:MAG: DUF2723 domain-containing protein, partial [Chitinophagaceae bacterium]